MACKLVHLDASLAPQIRGYEDSAKALRQRQKAAKRTASGGLRYLGRYRYLAAIKTTLDYEKPTHGCGIYLCCIFIYELVPLAELKQKKPVPRTRNPNPRQNHSSANGNGRPELQNLVLPSGRKSAIKQPTNQ